jgi:hypothetical protein
MSPARLGLTLSEHREVGAMLKRARRLLLDAAHITWNYDRLSRQLSDAANGLMAIRGELERKLIEVVGPEGMVEGTHVRDVYFGNVKEKSDA